MQRRLVWQIFLPLMLVVAGVLAAITTYTTRSLRSFYLEQSRIDLEDKGRLVQELLAGRTMQVGTSDAVAAPRDIDALAKRLGREVGTRITVIRRDGVVIADSDEDPRSMDNHAHRPEIEQALAASVGSSLRFSRTVRRNMLYVALPPREPVTADVIVRTSVPLTSIESALDTVYRRIAVAGVFVALGAILVSLLVARRISNPLEELGRGAALYAAGHLDHRLRVSGSREITAVAEGMNRMAGELSGRIRAIEEQRNRQEAVLSSMVEGVIAVDRDARLIIVNETAARLLGTAPAAAVGKAAEEVIRSPELLRFLDQTLAAASPTQEELTFHTKGARTWQAHGACIQDRDGGCSGAVVVLDDVTEMRRLETVRRDFVANVSHELRTPVTAIKGFLETLLDGALEDGENAERFVRIAARQADRLNAIIEDLLALSRLEQQADSAVLERSSVPMETLLENAIEACAGRASAKRVALELDCPPDLQAGVNEPLFEQAVINLIDNAVKYSGEGSRVLVLAGRDNGDVVVAVRDEGPGIEHRHLERLFERFYRVDKARSRDLGGTGLGLAIVKHIAQAHGGTAEVTSEPGKGSVFTIRVPARL